MNLREVLRISLAFTLVLTAGSHALAAEIPENIRQAYLKGAATVALPRDPVTIPLQGTDWYGHYRSPYLHVFINGHGPYTFLFDTGATITLVSSKVARAAAMTIVSRVPGHHTIAKAREVDTNGIRMRDYYVAIADGDDVDGILGFNSFGTTALTFDLKRRRLVVASKAQPLPSAFWLPYTLDHRLPTVVLTIDGRRLPTLIDSGDDAYAWEGTTNDLRGLLYDSVPVESSVVYNGETGATRTRITSIDGTLHLGPVHATRPAVAINESLPIPDIGVPLIEQFVVEFDRVHRRVGFEPLFAGREFDVPGELTCGVYISFRKPVRSARDVLPAGAPARAGLRTGDAILRINGHAAAGITYRTWDELLQKRNPITLTWKSGDQIKSATFPVVELR